jgi:hypothetical protein
LLTRITNTADRTKVDYIGSFKQINKMKNKTRYDLVNFIYNKKQSNERQRDKETKRQEGNEKTKTKTQLYSRLLNCSLN